MPSIFVAKLDFGVSDEELTSLFEEYGKNTNIHSISALSREGTKELMLKVGRHLEMIDGQD